MPPEVVIPDTDSNRASLKDRCTSSTSISGREPVSPSTTQNSTVMIKPSRVRSSMGLRLKGSHIIMPREKVMAKDRK